jgi:hypothetical protein
LFQPFEQQRALLILLEKHVRAMISTNSLEEKILKEKFHVDAISHSVTSMP